MPDLGMVLGTVRRSRGGLPQMPLVNMFSEQAITEPRKFALQSFPGLTVEGSALGNGPVRALLKKDGVEGGDLIAVSDDGLYVDGTLAGYMSVVAPVSIAGNEIGYVATGGGDAVYGTGGSLAIVAFPDAAPVTKVIEQGGRFLFLREGTQAFYWTPPLAVTIDGLDYASAESEPDRLLDMVDLGGRIALLGANSIEFWQPTGDSELPYTPIQGVEYKKGIRATGCAAVFDNSFAWVSPDNIVYGAGNVPQRISDAGVEELIAASATCRVDSYFFEGHEFLKIGLDAMTVEFDAQTRQWNERRTGIASFRGGPVAPGPLFGSNTDGHIYTLSGYTDLDGYHERSFCAGAVLNSPVPVDNLVVRTNPGATEYPTGEYAEPTIEMFQSYDGGRTFDDPLQASLGEQGHYRREIEWRALGLADAPGFFAKFRVSDPVDWRVSAVQFNEPQGGGRSR